MPPTLSGDSTRPRGKGKGKGLRSSPSGKFEKRPIQKNEVDDDKSSSRTSKKPQGKYTERYKYIRFVEKKKVVRKMRQLQQQLVQETDTTTKDSIESQLAEFRKDLMYIEKFPGDQKYISLFPSGEVTLSEECVKKQKEIREMIIKRTINSEKRVNQTAKMDVIKSDDFFIIPGVETTPVSSSTKSTQPANPTNQHTKKSSTNKSAPYVHPSWDAKKNNQRLTGSIANQNFEGKKITFDDD